MTEWRLTTETEELLTDYVGQGTYGEEKYCLDIQLQRLNLPSQVPMTEEETNGHLSPLKTGRQTALNL